VELRKQNAMGFAYWMLQLHLMGEGLEPINEDSAVDAQEHCQHGLFGAIVCTTLVQTSLADTHHICRWS
jgi:hypothetical protein